MTEEKVERMEQNKAELTPHRSVFIADKIRGNYARSGLEKIEPKKVALHVKSWLVMYDLTNELNFGLCKKEFRELGRQRFSQREVLVD